MSKIIIHVNNGKTFLLVHLPESWDYDMIDGDLWIGPKGMYGDGHEMVALPEGQWQLFGKADQLSEEQVKEIVPEYLPGLYSDYSKNLKRTAVEKVFNDPKYCTETAIGSLLSLLASHNLQPSTILILSHA